MADTGNVSGETAALIAAGGAAIGALIGAVAGGLVEAARERARRKQRAKVGARLVQLDLALAASRLSRVKAERKWWVFFTMPMEGWDEYKAPLVSYLSEKSFELVTQSVSELRRLDSDMRTAPLEEGAAYREVKLDETVKAIGETIRNATLAYNALAEISGDPPVKTLLHSDEPLAEFSA